MITRTAPTAVANLSLYFFLLCLVGCARDVIVVKSHFPTPLVNKLPLTVAIVFDEQFRNYRHEQDSKVRGEKGWTVQMGDAQSLMFKQLLAGVFNKTVLLETFPDKSEENVDAIFYPVIEDLQIAVPSVTKVNVFEVWLRYNLRLYNRDGDVIADWIMTAYGKTPTRFLKTQSRAVEQAAIVALRDAGANFVIGFASIPEVRQWLERENAIVSVPKTVMLR